MIIFIDACAGRAERDELMVKKYLDCCLSLKKVDSLNTSYYVYLSNDTKR